MTMLNTPALALRPPPRGATQPAVATQPVCAARPDGFCYVTVNLSGRLSVIDAPAGGAGLFPLGRRTTSGTAYRIDLSDDIACWLDGDHLGRSINPVATQICVALSGHGHTDWRFTTFAFGQVVFTGISHTGDPIGLSDAQLTRIADEHAHAEESQL
jgi:hypothetical protein